MKLKNLLTTMSLTATFLFTGMTGFGQVSLPHYDGLNYTTGATLQTQSGWAAVNSGDDLVITTGSLDYVGLKNSTGNKVTFASGGIDANKVIATQTTGTVYYSFIMNVTSLGSLNATGGYFTGFGQNNTTFGATVWTGLDGTGYKIGINPRTSTTGIAWVSGTQSLNNTVFVVISYTLNSSPGDDVVNMWVNPSSSTFGAATEPTVSASATNTGGTDLTGVAQIFIRQDSDTKTPTIEMDELRIGTSWADVTAADTEAPAITFEPANGATDVAINTNITISANEAVRNINDSEITSDNVDALITLKEKVSGTAVTFDATIDATKKIITIDPSTDLSNNLEYEVSIAPVEDVLNYATTTTSVSFTTISATTPTLKLTSPNGGEKYYAGTQATITWESTNIAAGETITISVAPDGTTYEQIATSTNDNTETVDIPTNAGYATTYKIKVAFGTAASDESDAAFTVIPTTNSLATLAAMPANSIVKYTGKATITYARESYNQKYIQDETGAILIHDPTTAPGYITETFAIGEGISNVEGKITLYKNLVELVPQATTGEKVTGNPTITPEVKTVASLTSADQSKLVRINEISFASPSNFATGTNYEITGYATSDFVLRTAFSEANYIGNAMPTGTFDCIGLVGQYNDVMQITPRSSDDIILPTYTVTFNVTRNSTAVAGVSIAINNQTLTTDANGAASVDLANGTYSYTTTKEGYNEYSGSVTVNSAAQTVNIVLTATGVNTNTFASLKAYPNPFSNEIRFEGASIARVTVTSIIGQVMIEEAVAGRNQISTEALPRGIYLVKFTNTKGETTLRKLVKE